jgi:hypothetical protein
MWNFMVNEVALGQVSPITSVSPANSHSTICSALIIIIIISTIIIRDWYNRPTSGRRTEWIQCHPNKFS